MIVDAAALAIFSISLVELALPLSVTSSGCCPADKISHYMAIQYALKVFEYEGKRPFRIIDRNGEPWFVLADVCRELNISNVGNAASRLDEDEKGSIRNPDVTSMGGNPNLTIINESGLYSTILSSRKPGMLLIQ